MSRLQRPESDAAAHHRLVGRALVGLGTLCALVGVATILLGAELAFIDGRAMVLTSVIMIGLGIWQVQAAASFTD